MSAFFDQGGVSVREDFPLLNALDEADEGAVYLDSAATTQKPACVLDAMETFYRTENANPHRSNHRLATAATEAYERARGELAGFIGAEPDEVVFTSGTTQGLNTVALCYGMTHLRPDDEIALTIMEHHSNLVPWQLVAKRTGAKLVYVLSDKTGRISDEAIDRAIGPKTKIVASTCLSNVLGTVAPIKRIVAAAHAHGAIVVADCAQSIAHLPLDVRGLGVDFAAFSGHKMYGPMGIGVLYGKRELLASMPPLLRGGGMIDDVFEQGSVLSGGPAKFEAGTQNVAGAVGLAAAARYLGELGFDRIREHERLLTNRMLEGLSALSPVKLFGVSAEGDSIERCGIVAFNVRGIEAADAALVLDQRGVEVRAGGHCAHPLMRHLGVSATCRASLGVYNTEQDIDAFLAAVEAAPTEAVAAVASMMF